MNYSKLYTSIIEHRLANPVCGYTENHHVIPRSLGGYDDKENLVKLTAREHFICHLLLTKIYKHDRLSYTKMARAFGMMLWMHGENQERYKVSSRRYQHLKKEFAKIQSEEQTGSKNSQFGWIWITNGIENKKIKGLTPIPEPWYRGRNLNSTRIKHFCQKCNTEFDYKSNGDYPKFCKNCKAAGTKKCVICNTDFTKRKVKTCSQKCKDQFSKTVNGLKRRKAIQCVETGETFSSITAAAKKINASISLISYMLSGNLPSAKGFTFKFVRK